MLSIDYLGEEVWGVAENHLFEFIKQDCVLTLGQIEFAKLYGLNACSYGLLYTATVVDISIDVVINK